MEVKGNHAGHSNFKMAFAHFISDIYSASQYLVRLCSKLRVQVMDPAVRVFMAMDSYPSAIGSGNPALVAHSRSANVR